MQRSSISCDVMHNISPTSDFHARALMVIQSCVISCIVRNCFNCTNLTRKKTRPDQRFCSTSALHRVHSRELLWQIIRNDLFSGAANTWCSSWLRSCIIKQKIGVFKNWTYLFSNLFVRLYTRARSAITAATPFYSLSSSRRHRGGARVHVAPFIHALDKIRTGPITFFFPLLNNSNWLNGLM